MQLIKNYTSIMHGFNAGIDYKSSIKIECDLWDVQNQKTDIVELQYIKESDIEVLSLSSETQLETLTFENTTGYSIPKYDTLYGVLTKTAGLYTVDLYFATERTEESLVAHTVTGVAINNTIEFIEQNNSKIKGSLLKNATDDMADDATLDFTIDATANNIAAWTDIQLMTGTQTRTNIQTNANGRQLTLYWDLDALPETNEKYFTRMQIGLNSDNSVVSPIISEEVSFDVLKQVIPFSMTIEPYTKLTSYIFDVSIGATDTTPTKYRAAEVLTDLPNKTWNDLIDLKAQIDFFGMDQGTKTFYVELVDNFYNKSVIETGVTNYHTTPPNNLYLKLTGSTNKEQFTGMTIENDRFVPTDKIQIDFYAEDLTEVYYYIDGDIKETDETKKWLLFDTENNSKTIRLGDENDFVDRDETIDVMVIFKDQADNQISIQKSIQFNTKLYQTPHAPLVTPSAVYDHSIMEVSNSGQNISIARKAPTSGEFVRKWEDIFYPATHGYPTNLDGTPDETACKSLNENSNEYYDAVDISGGQVAYDIHGRVTTVDWTRDGSKDYFNMESSYEDNGEGLRYWIIDNTGYGDFDVEFEHFRLDGNAYGPPYNPMSPYRGDQLVMYDASAFDTIEPIIGAFGKTAWKLKNSANLEIIDAFTGSGSNVYSLVTGNLMNANTNGGFTTEKISTTSKICFILYTDTSVTASGFKIKAGEKHDVAWENWEMDEQNGELWIHKYPLGNSITNSLRAIYNYNSTKINVDFEAGTVTFSEDPGAAEVKAFYSYYDYNNDEYAPSRTFMLYNDDLVDYMISSLYHVQKGIVPAKDVIYLPPAPGQSSPPVDNENGKITSKYTIDKDRGIIEYNDGTIDFDGNEYGYVPKGRVFADYLYHTYTRLSNDGYGNFEFNDETIVADTTTQYKDFTFGDVKLVNEGTAILEGGKMKFLPRGYDNDGDGVIDQVLDLNRPWDIQQGTAAETYNKVAIQINQSFVWQPTCTSSQALTIISKYKSGDFNFDFAPRAVAYGRIAWHLKAGGSYPAITAGAKCFSSELEGRFYNLEI